MSPEKEKRLIEVAQAYEAAVQKAVELKEKRDKLRASMNEVQKQLEAAAVEAEANQRAMFEVVAADLPPLPSTYAGDALQGGQSIVRLSDLGPRIGQAFAGMAAEALPHDEIRRAMKATGNKLSA